MKCSLCEHKWVVLLSWQLCSMILCSIGSICTYLSTYNNTTLPCLMLTITYFFLFLSSVYPFPKSDISWWRYILVGATCIGGDFLALLSYNYTSLASALLLVTTVIFYVAPLSYFVFKRKVSLWQIIGIILGFGGVTIVFFADKGQEGSKLLGDVLAILSAVCYAISTVTCEYLVRSNSIRLYIFRLSITAMPISGILTASVEYKKISKWNWSPLTAFLIILYSLLLAAYDIIVPIIMQYSNATEMNLSMLTSNFYSLLISILAFKQKASWFYLIGFICIPIAIVIYTLGTPKELNQPNQNVDDDRSIQDQYKQEEKINIDQHLIENANTSLYDGLKSDIS